MNIILVHLNCNDGFCKPKLPEYLEHCFEQLRFFNNCSVYFLTNKINIDNDIFEKYSIIPISVENLYDDRINLFNTKFFGSNSFWNVAAVRFFYIENFMKMYNIDNVIHFENDVLVYKDLSQYTFNKNIKNLCITPGGPDKCMTGMFYIKNVEAINHMNTYFLNIIKTNIIQNLMIKHHKKIDMFNEMLFLDIYSKEFGKDYLDYFPILPEGEHSYNFNYYNSIFDPASFGQYVGGSRTEGPGCKPNDHFIGQLLINNIDYTVKFDIENGYEIPYFYQKNKKTRINNLHIHSKNLHLYISKKKLKYEKNKCRNNKLGRCS